MPVVDDEVAELRIRIDSATEQVSETILKAAADGVPRWIMFDLTVLLSTLKGTDGG